MCVRILKLVAIIVKQSVSLLCKGIIYAAYRRGYSINLIYIY